MSQHSITSLQARCELWEALPNLFVQKRSDCSHFVNPSFQSSDESIPVNTLGFDLVTDKLIENLVPNLDFCAKVLEWNNEVGQRRNWLDCRQLDLKNDVTKFFWVRPPIKLYESLKDFICLFHPVRKLAQIRHEIQKSQLGSESFALQSTSIGKQDSKEGSYRCGPSTGSTPRSPVDATCIAQPPALANAIHHAHSLIPLWIGPHFAMGGNYPREASDV